MTLVTGKKFDPAPIESALSILPLVNDILIFGNGRPYPGGLVFPAQAALRLSDDDLIDSIWPDIEAQNANSQPHARLTRSMVQVVRAPGSRLEKSSKGSVLRAQAEKRFDQQIRQSYEQSERNNGTTETQSSGVAVSDEQLPDAVADIVTSVMGRTECLLTDADLFAHGVNSVACMQIRSLLQKVRL